MPPGAIDLPVTAYFDQLSMSGFGGLERAVLGGYHEPAEGDRSLSS